MREAWEAQTVEDREPAPLLPPRDEIFAHHLADEFKLLGGLIERAIFTSDERARIAKVARRLALVAREGRRFKGGVDAFMHEYGLTNEEGVTLMCLAESLLRIPDSETADQLIAEKVGDGKWAEHLGASKSTFVNASTWGLLLTGKVVKLRDATGADPLSAMKRLVAKSGEPVIRQALRHAMKVMADQFVLGRNIKEAVSRAEAYEAQGYRMSYDMLGEEALTEAAAETYFGAYVSALDEVGRRAGPLESVHQDALMDRPGLSVKLSAIHPRFEPGREAQLRAELLPRLVELARSARAQGIMLTIDAEEQRRLDVTLWAFGELFTNPHLADWSGLGIAVQAYSKRCIPVLRWLHRVALHGGKRIPIRLVKGAYWDSEIKWAQQQGFKDYPVFTRKLLTDVSYLAAMRMLLADGDAFYPQFASHNAHTIAAGHVASAGRAFEFQRLLGMGGAMHDEVVAADKLHRPCRIYAPVGEHDELLSYLIRRLLENGANSSFVNRLADDDAPLDDIIRDPVQQAELQRETSAGSISPLPKPADIYMPERKNAAAVDLNEALVRRDLLAGIERELANGFAVGPIVNGKHYGGGDEAGLVLCPHDRRQRIGTALSASDEHIEAALAGATAAAHGWDRLGGAARAEILERAADIMERDWVGLTAVIVREAGKTLTNAQGDIREAVDFLRYYARDARRQMETPRMLQSPTGETNALMLRGRGVFACISPWNFPIAIFTGQVAAALAAGNTVVAKPAEQTPVTASLAVSILHEAGVPVEALQLLPGRGSVGAALVKDHRVKGVAFTGSNDTAWAIQSALATKGREIIPFIAETGGINAMIVDSTALPEQVVRDAVASAFDSAGQRCSAARVLFLQDDIADKTIDMLVGATEVLTIGDPLDYATDVGPVIDETAENLLDAHKFQIESKGRKLVDLSLPEHCAAGTYVSPAIFEIDRMSILDREVFGPILHVVRYGAGHLDKVCRAINASGYGLTLGVHSRLASVADYVLEHARVGNVYVNRDQIGAVVGVQPFGGMGLSGTGPKAGGPHYLQAFATEQVRTEDVTATGGNAELLGMPVMDGDG